MKSLIGAFILVIAFASCSSKTEEVYIDNTFTETQVDSVVSILKKDNVGLQFEKLVYENGKIKEILGSVNFGTEYGEFSSQDFNYLKISSKSTGFEIEIE